MITIDSKDLKFGLMIICKDETETLRKSLNSIAKYVDEIVVNWNGSNPETEKVLKEFNCKIYRKEWSNDFSDARNFIMEKATGDLLLWLDADDVVVHPERIKETCEKVFAHPEVGALWCEWLYDHDENGNCVTKLWRERIVRRSWFKWTGRLHETLIQQVNAKHIITDAFQIKHLTTEEQIKQSAIRNLNIIADQYKKEHNENNVDAKTVLDLARALGSVSRDDEALLGYEEYVGIGGWDNDRAMAYSKMAEIYRKKQNWDQALNADLLVIKMKPDWPDGYLGLASTFYLMEKWEETIALITLGKLLEPPYGVMPCDPMAYTGRPLLLLHYALFQLGRFNECLDIINKALVYYPDNEILKQMKKNCEQILKEERLTKSVIEIKKQLEETKDNERLKALVNAVPDYMSDHPVFVRLRNKYSEIKKNNRIVIFCGPTPEAWSPTSVQTGIGGSEEAVINMARELVKLGWTVDVYTNCNNPANYDGVQYYNDYEYDKNEPCDIFIAWRMADYVKFAPKECPKIYLWLHDIQRPEFYNPEIVSKIDKIFALSKYHRNNLPDIPDDKFFITSNGIDVKHFSLNGHKKVPYKCIYASSPDRGLDILLEMWPKIKGKFPLATLDVYYGFTKTYDEIHKDDYNWTKYKLKVMEMLKQPGITYYGRVGHQEIADAFMQSEFLLYPTAFKEISCITAMKSQAGGVYPITTNLAALDETVQYGIKIKGDINKPEVKEEYLDAVLKAMEENHNKEREEMREWALSTYSWSNVAKSWDKLFK